MVFIAQFKLSFSYATKINLTSRSVGVLQGLLEAARNNNIELREDGQKIEKESGDQEIIEGRRGVAGQENEVNGGGEDRREIGRRRVRREASLGNGLGEKEKDATLRDIRCGKWFTERAYI